MFISPLDGRYQEKVGELCPIFSEFGLVKYRLKVEIEWLIFLSQKKVCPTLSSAQILELRNLIKNFDDQTFQTIKILEKTTNHDVKAVEIFLQSKTEKKFHPFIHFGCTSEDVNSTSYALILKDGSAILQTQFIKILKNLRQSSLTWKTVPMLARTHGQTATPTTMGKEFAVFHNRLHKIIHQKCEKWQFMAKFSGATGNFAAHSVAFPDQNWTQISREFVEKVLEISWNSLTTQIEPHDNQAFILNEIARANTVLIDFCRDIWGYISLGYFGQKVIKGEVGSSTMPHKVNPIDFENAEGNLKLARGISRTLADELPISRWQRDLTDSTLQRNFGLVFGHTLLALKSLEKGLNKLEIRETNLSADLEKSPEVLTEAVQTVLRKNGMADAYDELKKFSRGQVLNLAKIREFISQAKIKEDDKKRLLELTPKEYIGLSAKLVDEFLL